MRPAIASNSFPQHSIAIGGFLARLQPLHLNHACVATGRSNISKSTLFIQEACRKVTALSIFRCHQLRICHQVRYFHLQRTTSYNVVQRRTTPYDVVRRRTMWYDVVRRGTTPYDDIRRRTTSYDVVRRRATWYDVVRRRTTSYEVRGSTAILTRLLKESQHIRNASQTRPERIPN